MGFIFSTDESYTNFKRKKVVRGQLSTRMHVTFTENHKSKYKKTGCLYTSAALSRRVCLGAKAIVGYDKEANELVIVPSLIGNIKVSKNTSTMGGLYCFISLANFLLSQGVKEEDFPVGRYEVSVDEENNIHVYLNKPLPKEIK